MALLQSATNLDTARRTAHSVRMTRVGGPMGAGSPVRPAPSALLDDGRVGRHVRVPKTAELVAAHLRRQIVRGELVEGDALPPEAVLMEQFGVSRPTLREAFRVLESEALISVRRGAHGGARVHRPDGHVAARYAGLVLEHRHTTVGDVQHARAALETPAVRMLAESPAQPVLGRLRAALAESATAIDGRGAIQEGAATDPRASLSGFHHLLVELAGNQTLTVIDNMLRHILHTAANHQPTAEGRPDTPWSPVSADGHGSLAEHQDVHRHLVELIEGGDPDAAEALWRRHLAESTDRSSSNVVLDLLGG
ncbi:FadR family transcriptional regulator [Frankia sp. CNm7]|uniref:FadR family transcriptional regulator n=1 Tax=Frankia nepalensis TaxID=1836974 RepID=A0A937RQQ6_9ACTN|nr:GntR family transcriptional regulator [Frankia nepalensis]MBL7496449.1 FadR family transcriptional regulator [Frankia nepalensis]MBL7510814.1 FadR family transcriptional regulator [Frankia nepalensis]MBL7519052.1 FadR family transcriptional regulator [Frankia nepalensis]MBL7630236.1 FadR family transcriptional regulator [Frankia nepalensis]